MAPNDRSNRPSRPPEPGKWKSFGLAALMHVLLALALIFSLSWNHSAPGPVQAELWTALPAPNQPEPQPQPRPVPQPPQPVTPPPPPPKPQVTQPNPDIAIEQDRKRRQEQQQREAAEREAELKKQQQLKAEQEAQQKAAAAKAAADKAAADKAAAAKAAADKAAADKAAADKAVADKKAAAAQAERDRKLREAFRDDTARAAGLAGGRAGGTADRNQAGGGGGDPGYAALVRACIKPGVIYSASGSPADGNPTVVFRVQLMPSGSQAAAPLLQRSSGVPAFDRAVENGIRRCDPFPRPASGRYESTIDVQYRMFD